MSRIQHKKKVDKIMLIAAISSSACSTTIPASLAFDAIVSIITVEGDIGYAE